MAAPLTPHNFLLHLRNHAPALARRLDNVRGMGFYGGALRLTVYPEGWTGRELTARHEELEMRARAFFGPETTLALETTDDDPQRLPFAVTASKVWNHVVFVWSDATGRGLWVVRKPAYGDWVKAGDPKSESTPPSSGLAGEGPLLDALPGLADWLCTLARDQRSYFHLVTPFPGDGIADRWEGRLYGIKEWGTPKTPGSILHKYLGRIHYCDPTSPLAGVEVARKIALDGCPDGIELLK